jgi:hypothetical protein
MKRTMVPLPCRNSFSSFFGQCMFDEALWEEERKNVKKVIESQGEEIVDLKEQLPNKKQ